MSPFVLSLLKIVGSVALLTAVLWAVSRASRRFGLQPEIGRKLVHVSLGVYCLGFPLVFSQPWEVWATCVLAVGVFMLARAGPAKAALGGGLHAVQRVSYGEMLFALSVGLLFWLKDGHYVLLRHGLQSGPEPALYVVPLLILTLCDAACAVIGVNYGRNTFKVEDGIKSWEGVAVFFITAWLLSLVALLLISPVDRAQAVVLSMVAAFFGALFEGASWRGLDNLFIPLGLYLILAHLAPLGMVQLAAATGVFIVVTGLLLTIGRYLRVERHVTACAAALLFCIAIVSGIESLLTPAVAFVVYFAAVRLGAQPRPPHVGLGMILTALAVAVAVYLASNIASRDTIFAFNIAFAALAAAAFARFGPSNPIGAATVCVAALLSAAVRMVVIEPPRPDTVALMSAAAAAVAAAAAAGWIMARAWPERAWLKLGGVSLLAGLAMLPWRPA